MTLTAGEDGSTEELLLHLAGFDCLEAPDPRVEQVPTAPVLLPSRFSADAVPSSGTTFLLTRSGAALPTALLPRLDPGQVWILSMEDCDAPERLGFRCMALEALRKGGGAA